MEEKDDLFFINCRWIYRIRGTFSNSISSLDPIINHDLSTHRSSNTDNQGSRSELMEAAKPLPFGLEEETYEL